MNDHIICKHNRGMYDYLYSYKKTYMCQHVLIRNKSLCAMCTINDQRLKKGLSKINKQIIKSKSCTNWMLKLSEHRYCWKAPNLKKCDAPNCNYPALMLNNYTSIYQLINEVKNSIYLPSEIFKIIFSQLFPEICAGGNGLCVDHDKDYSECNECVFNIIPKCNRCALGLGIRFDNTKIMKYSHHHNTLGTCNSNTNNNTKIVHFMDDCSDHWQYFIDNNASYAELWCLDTCRRFNTWCDICNKCIGHPISYMKIDKHNIMNYPHCLICGIHSAYRHCEKCNEHSQCVCNLKHIA